MKVLFVGNFGHGWDGSICDEEHVARALQVFGVEVYRQQREALAGPGYLPPEGYDFTLISQWDGYSPDSIDALPKPLVYWAFDYQRDGQPWHERLIGQSSLYLSKRLADARHPNWQWLSQDFAPSFLGPFGGKVDKDIDVLFTGSYVPWESARERIDILKAVDERFNLVIHSVTPNEWKEHGFKNVYGPVMDFDLPKLIARAKVNLSIDNIHEAGFWSDRNAQIMACGGLVLFRYTPMSESTFHDGVLYFNSQADCLAQIENLLDRPEEDLALLGSHGQALARHTLMVDNRVSDLLTIVQELLCKIQKQF